MLSKKLEAIFHQVKSGSLVTWETWDQEIHYFLSIRMAGNVLVMEKSPIFKDAIIKASQRVFFGQSVTTREWGVLDSHYYQQGRSFADNLSEEEIKRIIQHIDDLQIPA